MVQQFLFLVNTSLFSLFSSGNLPSFIELVSLLDVSSRSLYFALLSKLCAIFLCSCQFVDLFRFLKRLYRGYPGGYTKSNSIWSPGGQNCQNCQNLAKTGQSWGGEVTSVAPSAASVGPALEDPFPSEPPFSLRSSSAAGILRVPVPTHFWHHGTPLLLLLVTPGIVTVSIYHYMLR